MIHYSRNIYFGKEAYEGLLEIMKDTGQSASQIIKQLVEEKIKRYKTQKWLDGKFPEEKENA